MNSLDIWEEKYRPIKLDDMILPERIKNVFKNVIDQGDIQNMIFSGGPGIGKTTLARAIGNELGYDVLFINGSENGNIDILRNDIRNFASSASMDGGLKLVIFDEGDYLNPNSTQPALRGFMEEFSANCRFIITCNYKNKLIPPLFSRMVEFDLDIKKDEVAQLKHETFNRLVSILTAEGVQYDQASLLEFVGKSSNDIRSIIKTLHTASRLGPIGPDILDMVNLDGKSIDQLIAILKEKQFTKMIEWVLENEGATAGEVGEELYKAIRSHVLNGHIESAALPELILIIAEYSYKAAFVANQDINTKAMLTEIMQRVSL